MLECRLSSTPLELMSDTAALAPTSRTPTPETLAVKGVLRTMQVQFQQQTERLQVQSKDEARGLRESQRIVDSRLSGSRTSADVERRYAPARVESPPQHRLDARSRKRGDEMKDNQGIYLSPRACFGKRARLPPLAETYWNISRILLGDTWTSIGVSDPLRTPEDNFDADEPVDD